MAKRYAADTKREYESMLAAGCTPMTPAELAEKLDELGYRISDENGDCFNYLNTHNKIVYNARSIYIVDKKTGLSFANINACRDRLTELQQLRLNAAVMSNGRVWEL